jgi:anti-sigma regulatory factor (Ser/Thr protein kinase)
MPGRSGELASGSGGHVVQFYGDDRELAASVGGYLGEGLLAEDSAVVVATLPHRLAFEAELARAGIDVSAAMAAGRLLLLDAARTLQGLRAGESGALDQDRFDAVAGDLIGPAAGAGQPVRIYAEMVALLWDAGHVAAAIELEALWSDLGSRLPFSLLCAYPARLVAGEADAGALEEVCRLHTGVIGPHPGLPGEAAVPCPGAEAVRSFPQAVESARAARHFVLDTLGPREDHALAADAAIVTAELAANAVLHARSGFTVAVSRSAASVRISVRDAAPLQTADDRAPLPVVHGRGLWVVAQVADDWAVEPLPDGKVVWAELPASPR